MSTNNLIFTAVTLRLAKYWSVMLNYILNWKCTPLTINPQVLVSTVGGLDWLDHMKQEASIHPVLLRLLFIHILRLFNNITFSNNIFKICFSEISLSSVKFGLFCFFFAKHNGNLTRCQSVLVIWWEYDAGVTWCGRNIPQNWTKKQLYCCDTTDVFKLW